MHAKQKSAGSSIGMTNKNNDQLAKSTLQVNTQRSEGISPFQKSRDSPKSTTVVRKLLSTNMNRNKTKPPKPKASIDSQALFLQPSNNNSSSHMEVQEPAILSSSAATSPTNKNYLRASKTMIASGRRSPAPGLAKSSMTVLAHRYSMVSKNSSSAADVSAR